MDKKIALTLKIVGAVTVVLAAAAAVLYFLEKKGIIACISGCEEVEIPEETEEIPTEPVEAETAEAPCEEEAQA